MRPLEPTDSADTDSTDQTDVPVYLPGTPTLGFTNSFKRLFDTLFR